MVEPAAATAFDINNICSVTSTDCRNGTSQGINVTKKVKSWIHVLYNEARNFILEIYSFQTKVLDPVIANSPSSNPLPSIMTTSWIVCECSSAD